MSINPDEDISMDMYDPEMPLFAPDNLPNDGVDAIRQRTLIQMEAWEGMDHDGDAKNAISPSHILLPTVSLSNIDPSLSSISSRSPRSTPLHSSVRAPAHRRSLSRSNVISESSRSHNLSAFSESRRMSLTNQLENPSVCTPEFLEHVSEELIRYHAGVTALLEKENLLPPAACDELRAVLENISNTVKHVKAEYDVVSLKSPVLALLELSNICWNFNNDTVMDYRNGIMNLEMSRHELLESIENSAYPRYMCKSIFNTKNTLEVIVKMDGFDPVSVRVNANKLSANSLIQQVLNGFLSDETYDDWVFKVEGFNDYIFGSEYLSAFDAVRTALRKNIPISLWLVPKYDVDDAYVERITNLSSASKEAFYERSGREKPVELQVITEDMDVEEINMSYFESPRHLASSSAKNYSSGTATSLSITPTASPLIRTSELTLKPHVKHSNPSSRVTTPLTEAKIPKLSSIPSNFALPNVEPPPSFFNENAPTLTIDTASSDSVPNTPKPSHLQPSLPRTLTVDVPPTDLIARVPSLAALTPRIGYEVVMKPKQTHNNSGRSTPSVASMILSQNTPTTADSFDSNGVRRNSKLPPPLPPGVATHHIDGAGRVFHFENSTTIIPLHEDNITTMQSINEEDEVKTNTNGQALDNLPAPSLFESVSDDDDDDDEESVDEVTRKPLNLDVIAIEDLEEEDADDEQEEEVTKTPTHEANKPKLDFTAMTPELDPNIMARMVRRKSIHDTLSPKSFVAAVPSISSGAALNHFFTPLTEPASKRDPEPSMLSSPSTSMTSLSKDTSDTSKTTSTPAPGPTIVMPKSPIITTTNTKQAKEKETPQPATTQTKQMQSPQPAVQPKLTQSAASIAKEANAPPPGFLKASSAARTSLFRYSVLNQEESLIKRDPKPREPIKVPKFNIPVIPDTDDGSSLIVDALPMAGTTKDINVSISMHIHGLDGINEKILPRLDSNITHLYVAMAIVQGSQILPHSVTSTDLYERTSCPRWYDKLEFPVKPVYFREIPRAAKYVFVLCGHNIESKKADIPLAWVTQHVFNRKGQALTGPVNLGIWPLPLENAEDIDMITMGLGASGHVTNIIIKDDKKKKNTNANNSNNNLLANGAVTKNFDFEAYAFVFQGTHRSNLMSEDAARLTVTFDTFSVPIYYSPEIPNTVTIPQNISKSKILSKDQIKELDHIENMDILSELTLHQKSVVWAARTLLVDKPHMLIFLIRSVDWFNYDMRCELYGLLKRWKPFTNITQILALLDWDVPDITIRDYAVKQLRSTCTDNDLRTYLLQLTQGLKFELYHESSLSRFLVERAIASPLDFGHYFFWALRNEIDCDPPHAERYVCMLDAFLSFSSVATDHLRSQQIVMDRLERLALSIQNKKSKCSDKELQVYYKEQIEILNRDVLSKLPGSKFKIPLDPRWEATTLDPDKCKIMSSKMAPLWLVFNNAHSDRNQLYVMFKAGDDLRQDILTLQILRYMDDLWIKNGMNLRLSPYNVVAAGLTEKKRGCGLIEIMLKSCTTAGIQMQYGGGAGGAFKLETLDMYLRDHNKEPEQYQKAVENFTYSCAGYCVATYVMGIGDRHNDNIMLTHDGHLFHIDFGHILGNFKFKYGFKRERSAFVFTPEMAYVIGGKNYESSQMFKEFKNICYQAFLCLRRHASELETLFNVMLNAGLPELTSNDLQYLRHQLCLEYSDAKASDVFKQEIKKALSSTSRRFDNYFHLLKHAK